jgi:hypothetical protein
VVDYLMTQFGGTAEAAIAAMQLPGFRDEFPRQTGAALETDPSDGHLYIRWPALDRDRTVWKLVEAAVGPDSRYAQGSGDVAESARRKPRHRTPEQLDIETVKKLKLELAKRKAGGPRDPEYTQGAIAQRLGWKTTRVQQAEGLQKAGWDLLRSHPDFLVDDGFVRWPGVQKAARLLASGRTRN